MTHNRSRPDRVYFLDELRGLCILLMVVYHAAYDLVYIFNVNIPVFHSRILAFAQPFVAGIFIFISGIACRYSKNNLKRGIMTLSLGIVISAVTFVFMRDQMIWFGILHFLGISMMLFPLLRPAMDKTPVDFGLLLCAALFVFTFNISQGSVGIASVFSIALPASLYESKFLFPFGFSGGGADYFPLFPWAFVFLAGAYLGKFFVSGRMPQFFYRKHVPFLSAVGRYTIIIYILHQPVVYGILQLVFILF